MIRLASAVVAVPLLIFGASAIENRPQRITGCYAIDGDTLSCPGERVRLVAIDAPELPGHCRAGRDCFVGPDPLYAKASLQQALEGGDAVISRMGRDGWRRTVADVHVSGKSLSCWQLESGMARYWPKYDPDRLIAKECGI